jgi:hypothetical protein
MLDSFYFFACVVCHPVCPLPCVFAFLFQYLYHLFHFSFSHSHHNRMADTKMCESCCENPANAIDDGSMLCQDCLPEEHVRPSFISCDVLTYEELLSRQTKAADTEADTEATDTEAADTEADIKTDTKADTQRAWEIRM